MLYGWYSYFSHHFLILILGNESARKCPIFVLTRLLEQRYFARHENATNTDRMVRKRQMGVCDRTYTVDGFFSWTLKL